MDTGAWQATVHGGHRRVRPDSVTKPPLIMYLKLGRAFAHLPVTRSHLPAGPPWQTKREILADAQEEKEKKRVSSIYTSICRIFQLL